VQHVLQHVGQASADRPVCAVFSAFEAGAVSNNMALKKGKRREILMGSKILA
jgi:hypothetical protein